MLRRNRNFAVTTLVTLVVALLAQSGYGRQFFYRVLGAESNAPILPKSRSVCGRDGSAGTGTTGMADSGFTEYPSGSDRTSFGFIEMNAYFPRIGAGILIDTNRVTTAGIVMDFVYEPDGCVWGLAGREFAQTFTASGRELVSLTMLVASEPGTFVASLHEGGAGGPQIGSAHAFKSGSSMEWGNARWKAGEAPLEPGRTYAVRIRREDGKSWSPYLHATGNPYDGGLLYVDGIPRPESDIAAWIVEEPPEMTRALVPDSDVEGWVHAVEGAVFVPRSKNVRLISVIASPLEPKVCDVVLRVWTDEANPKLIAGPKQCLSWGVPNGPHGAHFIFGADELPVTPGRAYKVDFYAAEHGGGVADPHEVPIVPQDIRLRVYGEPVPGALPAVFNVDAEINDNNTLQLSWSTSYDCPARIWIREGASGTPNVYVLDAGTNSFISPPLKPGEDCTFRITALGSTGLEWDTVVYRLRVPGDSAAPETAVSEGYPEFFPPLAPPRWNRTATLPPLRVAGRVAVTNPAFREGLEGWSAGGPDAVYAAGPEHGITPPSGSRMAGWSLIGQEPFEQVFAESALSQRIPTIPGHEYVLSVYAHTSVEGGPRGDTRVRLFTDPRGGTEFDDGDASQWYWTDGSWMRFRHRWIAEAETSTIGVGFFRWRDLKRASAYVADVAVFDLGPSAPATADAYQAPHPELWAPATSLQRTRTEGAAEPGFVLDAPPGFVITGFGVGAADAGFATVRIRVQPLLSNDALGDPEEILGGTMPDGPIVASVDLPPGYVATGYGLAPPSNEGGEPAVTLWGRRLSSEGELAEEEIYRAGANRTVGSLLRLEQGRVLAGIGWTRDAAQDQPSLSARSAVIAPTATATAQPAGEQ